jgi:hypothetical protein
LIASVAATVGTGPSEAGSSVPRVTAVPYTSGDWEFAHKLFVELNREAIGIPGDGVLVDLVSDDEEATEDDAGCNTLGVKHAFASHLMSISIIYTFMIMVM